MEKEEEKEGEKMEGRREEGGSEEGRREERRGRGTVAESTRRFSQTGH